MKATMTFKVLGIILAAAVILFGGIGLTGVAAQSAIPGDTLYPVKTTIENTRISLAQDSGNWAQILNELAAGHEQVNENENVNVNANDNSSINDVSNTNGNDTSDDSANGNSNANDNGNASVNTNDHGDDNSNGGMDDNSNNNDDDNGKGSGKDD